MEGKIFLKLDQKPYHGVTKTVRNVASDIISRSFQSLKIANRMAYKIQMKKVTFLVAYIVYDYYYLFSLV